VANRTRDAVKAVSDTAMRTKDRVGEWMSEAGETAQEYAGEAYERSKEAIGTAGEQMTVWVRRYPLTAVAIGFGLGMLLARATSSRS
jgi:ElaB/YqjD/DUF883 family membrane-anchored ribosome-binding protein